MAVPSGYIALAKVGLLNRGTYSASATYNKLDFVYYNGSSWTPKKDNLKGVTPAEGDNWQILAQGFASISAASITATDTSNTTGAGAGKASTVQKILDAIAAIAVKAITTAKLVNNGTTTEAGYALDARYGKTLQDSVDTLNRNIIGSPEAPIEMNPNNTTRVISIVNGWDEKTVNVPDYYKNKWAVLITVWAYPGEIGNTSSSSTRLQALIGDKCSFRKQENGTWDAWSTPT